MRKRRAVKRDVLPDPIYKSKLVTKLVNSIMLDGKKGVAQKILYEAFDIVKEKTSQDPMEVFEKALDAESRASENEIIHCMSSLYDYHKSEHRAAVKTIEAMRLKSMLTILLVFIAFLIVLAAGFILRIRKKHHDAVKHYLKNVTQLRKAREEILILKHSADGFQKVLKEKEDSLARLESLVNEYQNKNLQNLSYNESESSLEGTEVYNHFHVLANKGIKPTSEDWLALDDLMREKHCAFYDLMLRKKTILKEFKFRKFLTCQF